MDWNVKTSNNMELNGRTCNNCSHKNVCKYMKDVQETIESIHIGRELPENIKIVFQIECKHWGGPIIGTR